MLVTIHNLPSYMRYADIKALLQTKCGLEEVILDNLINEGKTKKVTVGVAEEEEAAILTRNLNGLYLDGQQLYVRDVRQKTASKQPYYTSNPTTEQPPYDYQQMQLQHMQMGQVQGYPGFQAPGGKFVGQGMGPDAVVPMMMPNMMGGMYYMPQAQNSFMDYTGQMQLATSSQHSQFPGQEVQTQARSGPARTDRFEDNYGGSANRPAYDNGQRSHSPTRGKSRQDDSRENRAGESSHRSQSPRRSGRSRDKDRRSPNRGHDEYRPDNDRRDTKTAHDSQRYGSSCNEPFSQTRGNQDSSNTSINTKLMSLSNNIQPGLLSAPLNPWESSHNSQPRARDQVTYENTSQRSSHWDRQSQSQIDNVSQHRSPWEPSTSFDRSQSTQVASTYDSRSKSQSTRNRRSRSPVPYEPNPPKKGRYYERNDREYSASIGENKLSKLQFQPSREFSSGTNRLMRPERPFENKTRSFQQAPTGGEDNHRTQKSKPTPPVDAATLVRRDTAYRLQAAAEIVKEMKNTHNYMITDEMTMKNLKKAVRTRLDLILVSEKIGISQADMITKYRSRFPPNEDRKFYETVVAAQARENAANSVTTVPAKLPKPGPVPQNKPAPQINKPAPQTNKPAPQINKPAPKQNIQTLQTQYFGKKQQMHAKNTGKNRQLPEWVKKGDGTKMPAFVVPPPDENLPKYPNADKDVQRALKKIQQDESTSDNYYKDQMVAKHPLEEAALLAEADAICNIFKRGLENPSGPVEKRMCAKMLEGNTLKELKRVILLHVSKRILNVHTNLMLRAIARGKGPKKAELSDLLAQHGVVSMKKSVGHKQLYVLTCADIESYDKLCKMEKLRLNENTHLSIKPMLLLGPTTSIHERRAQMKQARKESTLVRKQAFAVFKDFNLADLDFSKKDVAKNLEELESPKSCGNKTTKDDIKNDGNSLESDFTNAGNIKLEDLDFTKNEDVENLMKNEDFAEDVGFDVNVAGGNDGGGEGDAELNDDDFEDW